MKDLAIEVAERLEAATGVDFDAAVSALLDGRVRLGALGPSGRVGVAEESPTAADAILSLVTGAGMGLVASLDGGAWVTVRELQPVGADT